MKKILLLMIFCNCIIGCVSTEFNYNPPSDYPKIKTVKTINKSKEKVWASLISAISNTFFVINNIDKDSGIINISYSGDAEKYVDCGTISSYVKNLYGERRYVFNAATSSTIYEKEPAHTVKHSSNLSGRINLLVTENKGKTNVSINARYVVMMESHSDELRLNYYTGNFENRSSNSSATFSFNSNGSELKDNGLMCVANGSLEKEILDLIK